MEFPLAERELTRRARQWPTYVLRLLAPGIVFLGAVWFGLFAIVVSDFAMQTIAGLGIFFGIIAHLFQQGVAFVLCVLWASPALAQEREERTLDLLLAAGRSNFDVYGAKFLAVYLPAALLILSVIPLLAIASLLGGVPVVGAAIETFSLLAAAAATTGLSLLASRFAIGANRAYVMAMVFTAVYLVGGEFLDSYSGAYWQIGMLRGLDELDWLPTDAARWAPGVGLALILTIVSAAAGSWNLGGEVGAAPQRSARAVKRRKAAKISMAGQIARAAMGAPAATYQGHVLRVALACVLPVVVLIPCLGVLLLYAGVVYEVVVAQQNSRRTGALDDLLVTPLGGQDLARAILAASMRRSWIYTPAIFVAALAFVFIAFSMVGVFDLLSLNEQWFAVFATAFVFCVVTLAGGLAVTQYISLVALACFCGSLKMGAFAQTLLGIVIYAFLVYVTYTIVVPIGLAAAGLYNVSGAPELFSGMVTCAFLFGVVFLLHWVVFMIAYTSFQHRLTTVLRTG